MTPLRVTRAGILGSILVLAVAAGCVRLGFWQLHRLAERRAHNAVVRARLSAPPLALQAVSDDTAGLAFRPASAFGRWDSERAIVLAGRTYDDDPGVYLLTPLLLPGGGAVLVNRGWLPSPDAATVDARAYAVSGAAAVRGLLVPMATGQVPRVPGFRRVWFHLDPVLLRRQFPYPLAPLLLQITPAAGDRGLPRPVPPPALSEGPHLSYAVQWFSFAAIGLIGWVVLLLRTNTGREERIAPGRGPGATDADGSLLGRGKLRCEGCRLDGGGERVRRRRRSGSTAGGKGFDGGSEAVRVRPGRGGPRCRSADGVAAHLQLVLDLETQRLPRHEVELGGDELRPAADRRHQQLQAGSPAHGGGGNTEAHAAHGRDHAQPHLQPGTDEVQVDVLPVLVARVHPGGRVPRRQGVLVVHRRPAGRATAGQRGQRDDEHNSFPRHMIPSFLLRASLGRTPPNPHGIPQRDLVNFRAPRGPTWAEFPAHMCACTLFLTAVALVLATPARAQLRPTRPLEWDAFAPGNSLIARAGVGLLAHQRASLAGTEGRLLELGDYALTWRQGPVAVGLAGTLVRRLDDQTRFAEPVSGAEGGLGARTDAGDLTVTTALRLTPSAWPAFAVLRFGARLPTSDHVKGLDRGETDFLGLLGIGTARGRLVGGLESGIGILGTRIPEFTQQDTWVYVARLGYRLGAIRPQATFTGQTSPLHYRRIRGNEDLRELRLGLHAGGARWLEVEWVRGLIRFSPRAGLLLSAGLSSP